MHVKLSQDRIADCMGKHLGTYEHSSDRSEVIVVSACGSAIPWVNVYHTVAIKKYANP